MSFGYGIMIADIQATDADGKTYDCVRKLHQVSNSLVAGFAGNIYMGFGMIFVLKNNLQVPEGSSWQDESLVPDLPPLLREAFQTLSKDISEEDRQVQIMLVGVHPSKNVPHDTPWPLPYCYIFKSPYFEVEQVALGSIASIGSGNGITTYVEKLEDLTEFKRWGDLAQMEIGSTGGFGKAVLHSVGDIIEENPTVGISPHLLMALVERGKIQIWPNNKITYVTGREPQAFTMPPVASTWTEFKSIFDERSGGSLKATACIA